MKELLNTYLQCYNGNNIEAFDWSSVWMFEFFLYSIGKGPLHGAILHEICLSVCMPRYIKKIIIFDLQLKINLIILKGHKVKPTNVIFI